MTAPIRAVRVRASVDTLFARVGAALLATTALLLVVLATLPGQGPVLAETVSTAAYGPWGGLASIVLLVFGLATGALAAALGLRLAGTAGIVCGTLVAVWAVAAVVDTFLRTTSRTHSGTAFEQPHTVIAVAGIVAQLVVAPTLLAVVHRRSGRVPRPLAAMTALVVLGVVAVIVHPDSLAGLSERALLAASGVWMLVAVQAARSGPPCSGPRPSTSARRGRTPARPSRP